VGEVKSEKKAGISKGGLVGILGSIVAEGAERDASEKNLVVGGVKLRWGLKGKEVRKCGKRQKKKGYLKKRKSL